MIENMITCIETYIEKHIDKINRALYRMFCVLLFIIVACLGGCEAKEVDKEPIKSATISANVKDLTPPIISSTKDTFDVTIGTTFILQDNISVIDNMDGELGYECVGSFDINTSGQYILQIIAKDADHNQASKNITINVVNKVSAEVPVVIPEKKSPEKKETPTVPEVKEEVTNPPILTAGKTYLFIDGYNMSTAVSACRSDLYKSGRAGICDSITDSKGIYLGMQLLLK